MKKALVVLLILAVAGGAFAQGFTFSGYLNGGLGVFIPDGGTAYVAPISRDAGVAGMRARFIGAYTNEDNTAGLNFRLQAQNDYAGTAGLYSFFDFYYGWVSALGGMVTVYGGRVDNGTFNTSDAIFADDMGEGLGLLTIIKPIPILQIGLGGYATGVLDPTTRPAQKLGDVRGTVGIAVTTDAFKIVAAARNPNKIGDTTAAPPTNQISQGSFGFAYTGMKDLTAALAVVGENLEEFGDIGTIRFFETFGYNGITNLSLNLSFWEGINQATGKDFSFRVWFWASYALKDGDIVPRLDVNYLVAGEYDNFQRLHLDDRYAATYNKDQVLLSARPSVSFKANSNSWLEIGYLVNYDLGDASASKNTNASTSAKGVHSAIYADIRVSF
jgi:hypothetical protein